jgi:hypothetical protein
MASATKPEAPAGSAVPSSWYAQLVPPVTDTKTDSEVRLRTSAWVLVPVETDASTIFF